MSPVGFKPIISAGERPQTYALDLAATGTGNDLKKKKKNIKLLSCFAYMAFEFRNMKIRIITQNV
jgi:hypothetical protein